MAPTRRDLLKISAGTVAAALTATTVVPSIVEPVAAEPEPTWTITTPMIMECSDGRRWCVLPTETHTLVISYAEAFGYEHESVWVRVADHQQVWDELTAMTERMVRVLANAGVE